MHKKTALFLILCIITGNLSAQDAERNYDGAWFDEGWRIRLHLAGTRFSVFLMESEFEAMGFLIPSGDRYIFDTRECTFSSTPSDDGQQERLSKLVLVITAGEYVPPFLSVVTQQDLLVRETVILRDKNRLTIEVLDKDNEIIEINYFYRME